MAGINGFISGSMEEEALVYSHGYSCCSSHQSFQNDRIINNIDQISKPGLFQFQSRLHFQTLILCNDLFDVGDMG